MKYAKIAISSNIKLLFLAFLIIPHLHSYIANTTALDGSVVMWAVTMATFCFLKVLVLRV